MDRRTFLVALLAGCTSVQHSKELDTSVSGLEFILENSGQEQYMHHRAMITATDNYFNFIGEQNGRYWFVANPKKNPTMQDVIAYLTNLEESEEKKEFLKKIKVLQADPTKKRNTLVHSTSRKASAELGPKMVYVPREHLRDIVEVKYDQTYFLKLPENVLDAKGRSHRRSRVTNVRVGIKVSELQSELETFKEHRRTGDYREFAIQSSSVRRIANDVAKNAIDKEHAAQLLLNFVQSFDYLDDGYIMKKHVNIPRGPLATLLSKGGDCEDTAILYATLLRSIDVDCALLYEPGHVLVGVVGRFQGKYAYSQGTRYFTAETAATNRVIGDHTAHEVRKVFPLQ